jgi:hypothetical protein
MYAGVSGTDADIILFLDADLIGISGEQIDSIIRPVAEEQVDMCIGVFRGGRGITDIAQFVTPYISGQRALPRSLFLDIPCVDTVRSGVEVTMTKYFRTNGLTIETVPLVGCTHPMKEEKIGYLRGFVARMRMYNEIARITLGAGRNEARRGLRKLVRRKESHQG